MATNSYSAVLKGWKPPALPPPTEDSNCPLAWRPTSRTLSPSKGEQPSPAPPAASYCDFPGLGHDVAPNDGATLLPQGNPRSTTRSWAAITRGDSSPPKVSLKVLSKTRANDVGKVDATLSAEPEAFQDSCQISRPASPAPQTPLADNKEEDDQLFQTNATMGAISHPPSPAMSLTLTEEAEIAEKTVLWRNPKGADLLIRGRRSNGYLVQWRVHAGILINMSEGWMEKYMPPENEDGSMVQWDLFSWDAGMLGAVLQYMYLKDFAGGLYNSVEDPHNIEPLVQNVAHFIAGTGCLCRPLMDQAVDQIDAMTEKITKIRHLFRPDSNLDQFEDALRRALCIMYDEPDQWRIRSLRMVMGKLLNVCFPFLLKNSRWESDYKEHWTRPYQNGLYIPLQIRVVSDHSWLYRSKFFPRNADIMNGFDHMVVTWIRYRHEGWKPEDDLIFPSSEDGKQPAPLSSCFSAPITPAGGKKKSKAIPIIKPEGNHAAVSGPSSAPGNGAETAGSNAKKMTELTGMVELGHPKVDTPAPIGTVARAAHSAGPSFAPNPSNAMTSEMSPAITQSTPDIEDPFAADTSGPGTFTVPSPSALQGSAPSFAYHSHATSHRPLSMLATSNAPISLPGTPARPQNFWKSQTPHMNGHLIPMLPDGNFFYAEDSQGKPDPKYSASRRPPSISGSTIAGSNAPSVAGMSSDTASAAASVTGKSQSASAAQSANDPSESPTPRMAELNIGGYDGNDDEQTVNTVDPRATPPDVSSGAKLKKSQPKKINSKGSTAGPSSNRGGKKVNSKGSTAGASSNRGGKKA